jgi:type IV secretory pathway VirB4 component
MLQDDRGVYLGYNAYPVFVNFFARNSERVNSNMMVIGKSGAGKSFTTKTLLTNMAADNTRIFILDPENEYEILCKNLHGKIIDVGTSTDGIFNPFHIYATLESEEGEHDDSFNAHLQFLEQFFKLILPGINADAFEKLNSIVAVLYDRFKIGVNTNVSGLGPEDFPIFDDLVELVDEMIAKEKDEYHLRNLQTIRVYIEKFSTGGRNSNLWNGPNSIRTNENFICFSFRTLISNRNDIIANAQMLLVFKYLDNEIIKNRDFNLKYFANEEREEDHRRVIVAVDEAHVFINKKYPIALDFMAQMAKRIRKYNGMQIIITQNIKDFVGSEEIQQQSTAIINACQYSLILSLAPNDMNDLINLYRNAGGINDSEKDSIIAAKRGQVFLITGPMNRTTIQIHALANTKVIFEQDLTQGGDDYY